MSQFVTGIMRKVSLALFEAGPISCNCHNYFTWYLIILCHGFTSCDDLQRFLRVQVNILHPYESLNSKSEILCFLVGNWLLQ